MLISYLYYQASCRLEYALFAADVVELVDTPS